MVLYHSFPRPRIYNPPDKGLKILDNILKYGLLLVPEIRKYPKLDEEEKKPGEYKLIQCRFCMTAIDDENTFKKHTEDFGNIHIYTFALRFLVKMTSKKTEPPELCGGVYTVC